MTQFALTLPALAQKWLFLVMQGAFTLYALFSLVVIARYTFKKIATGRLIDGLASPEPLAIPPAGPWMYAFNVMALLFVQSTVYVAVIVAVLLVLILIDKRLARNRGILPYSGAWLFVVNIFALILMQSPLFMVLIVMSLTVLLLESGRTAQEQFGLERLPATQVLKWSVLISGAVVAVVSPLTQLYELVLNDLPYAHPEQQSVEAFRRLANPAQIADFFLEAVLIVPLLEELFFRGFFQALLKKFMPTWTAVLLGAGIFALAHLNLESFVGLWVLGIVLGVVYEHTGSILLSIGIHACFNLTTALTLLAEKGNPY